ncbi:hypothetical protein SprV_0100341500 [Sparganum proliferum]
MAKGKLTSLRGSLPPTPTSSPSQHVLECPCPAAVDQRHLYHSCSNIRDDDDDDDDDVRYFSHSATSQNTLDDPSAIIPTVAAPIRGDVDLVSTLKKKKKKKKKKKTRSPGQELY